MTKKNQELSKAINLQKAKFEFVDEAYVYKVNNYYKHNNFVDLRKKETVKISNILTGDSFALNKINVEDAVEILETNKDLGVCSSLEKTNTIDKGIQKPSQSILDNSTVDKFAQLRNFKSFL